jgi:hypothetical protein
MYLAGTCTGQVWLCTAAAALLGGGSSKSAGRRLLLDLQQPVVAVLPFHICGNTGTAVAAADAAAQPAVALSVLVVGKFGRVALLQAEQRQHSAAATAGGAATVAQLHMAQQQLSFQVAAANMLHTIPQQGQLQQEQQQQHMLLLMSSSGHLYAADIAAAAAAAAAAALQQGATGAAAAQRMKLQPVELPLPPASRFWVVHSAQSNMAGTSSSSIVMQLAGSNQLVQLEGAAVAAYIQQQLDLTCTQHGQPTVGSCTAAAAGAAAAAVRQQVQGLLSGLEVLAAARQLLEQAVSKQDAYLTAVGQDIDVLSPAAAAAAAAAAPSSLSSRSAIQPPATAAGGAVAPLVLDSSSSSTGLRSSKLRCKVQLHGIWPTPAAVSASPDSSSSSSSLHLAVAVQLYRTRSSSSSGGSNAAAPTSTTLGPGWQVMVSFLPESAHNASCQTSVSSSSGLALALLLPLPACCAGLEEGGWLHVYAVKMPPACLTGHNRAPQHMQPGLNKQQQQATAAQAGGSQLLPAVTLLAQRYVSCLQLSRLLDANPAAAAAARMVTAARAQASLPAAAAAAAGSKDSTSRSSSSSYSCVLHMKAAAYAAAGDLQQQVDGVAPAAKRPKQEAAVQHISAHLQAQQLPTTHQQQHQACSPLGAVLGSWLADLTCCQQQQQHHDAGVSSTFGSSAAGLLLPFSSNQGQQAALALPGMPPLALLNAQVGVRLGHDCQAQLAWAARPHLPSQQQQQQQVLPVQLALQATSVPALAQLHRAVLLALLEELNGSHMGSCRGAVSASVTTSSSSSRWRLELQQPQQLRSVLRRLKQLQHQLMLLQDVADEASEARAVLVAAVEAAAGAAGLSTGTAASAGSLSAGSLVELQQQQVKWGRGLQAVYGRMLLALADAACVVCQEA